MDGLVDEIFAFAPGKEKAARERPVVTDDANVEYGGNRLYVTSPRYDRAVADLLVGSEPMPRPSAGRRSPLAGLALARYSGAFRIDFEGAATLARERGFSPMGDNEDCMAGGPGSTSCSINCGAGSCSVNCGSGTYSCCNCSGGIPSCRCVPVIID